jgi:Ni/Fe-hydrogenase subunit HybB-like protein
LEVEGLKRFQDEALLSPIGKAEKKFYITASLLGAIIIIAIAAYIHQYNTGLAVTGLSRQIFWGVYLTNFVFFIGISHAGALIVAVLRLVRAEWRRPIARAAELITVLSLIFGVANVLIDLGRVDRMINLFAHPNFSSPLLWDIVSVTLYLTVSTIFLLVALIPDVAILRDTPGKKLRWLYRVLSFGWIGSEKQRKTFDKIGHILSVAVVMIAVSVHTVVSFVFVMTIQPMWHAAILAPYFVVGAIFSGIATIILIMAITRRAYHLESYIKPIHFYNLGLFLLAMCLFWFYFTLVELITAFYGNEPVEIGVFWAKLTGNYSIYFWSMFSLCFIIPLTILAFKKLRTIAGTVIASISVIIGMWIERYTIIIPTLNSQRLVIDPISYRPTWVEWSILAGCAALFTLLYMIFTKIFPIVSIHEINEGREHEKLS